MGKALDGVRILDFTHVQSGPTCTQFSPGSAPIDQGRAAGNGDITRGQLRDMPNADSLYFTMLNHNKRSITLDTKNPKGKEVLEALVKSCECWSRISGRASSTAWASPGSGSSSSTRA